MNTLDDSCVKYINHIIHVKTHYGNGWSYPENAAIHVTNKEMEPIPSFNFRLINLFQNKDNSRIGGIGIIEDEKCRFNGIEIEFTTRYSGIYNFETVFPECSITILTSCKKGKDNVFGWGLLKAKIV